MYVLLVSARFSNDIRDEAQCGIWVQEAVKDGFVDPRRVPTKDNTSDVFTKTLGVDDINRLRPGLTGYGPLPMIPESMPT